MTETTRKWIGKALYYGLPIVVFCGGLYYSNLETARQRALAASAEARYDGLEALLADDHFGLITVDSSNNVLDWNPGVTSLTGVAENDAVGKPVGWLICDELTDTIAAAFRERSETPDLAQPHTVNCNMIAEDAVIRCRVYAVNSRSGETIGVIMVDKRNRTEPPQ